MEDGIELGEGAQGLDVLALSLLSQPLPNEWADNEVFTRLSEDLVGCAGVPSTHRRTIGALGFFPSHPWELAVARFCSRPTQLLPDRVFVAAKAVDHVGLELLCLAQAIFSSLDCGKRHNRAVPLFPFSPSVPVVRNALSQLAEVDG